jgi:hypothetical protein
MTDWRALCAELVLRWDVDGCDWKPQHQARWNAAIERARTLLAQSAPPAEALAARPLLEQVARMGDRIGQHTVAEIMVISDRAAAWLRENPPGQPVAVEPRGCPTPGACSCVEPTPPTEGEVAELVEWLSDIAGENPPPWARYIRRAADLLQHHQPPQPVPVGERLPRPEDCDAEGRCWWFNLGIPGALNSYTAISSWRLCRMLNGKPMCSHWLPAHALPIPSPLSENV